MQRCKEEVVRLFLNYDRVDPNKKHINGMTPLLVAGSLGELQSVHVINMLLEDSRAYLKWFPTIVKRDNAPSVFPYPVSMTTGKETSK